MKSLCLGSNPSRPTMAILFKYNEKLYQASDLSKKLKRLKLGINDIEVIKEGTKEEIDKEYNLLVNPSLKKEENSNKITLYTYSDGKREIVSVYPNLNHLKDIADISNYKLIKENIYDI